MYILFFWHQRWRVFSTHYWRGCGQRFLPGKVSDKGEVQECGWWWGWVWWVSHHQCPLQQAQFSMLPQVSVYINICFPHLTPSVLSRTHIQTQDIFRSLSPLSHNYLGSIAATLSYPNPKSQKFPKKIFSFIAFWKTFCFIT